ncbi:hypothetical protein SAMN06273570_1761 [Candidatus Pantoea floridensis]|uniref:Uncharacterized protein n=1 Tax=Candidatus Pantoea floridensis TaxID=1938870 RepID=A0A286BTG5_9GAMM|nr:hypothetical protein BX596_3439 [Enterobacteriaceae bacterium JKS000233]SOD37408.1 hypothetical protein SAMN06273570_1761 [Pantoea floridensis]
MATLQNRTNLVGSPFMATRVLNTESCLVIAQRRAGRQAFAIAGDLNRQ